MAHEKYMQRCLELAQKASGFTSPNPMVGAVLVHEGRTIGEGYHHYYGAPHAEVNCLDDVASADRHLIPHSTLYVNLEPCAHYGLTPPCATRIITEQIKRVVVANTDPFGEVNGRGIAILKEMGTEVITDVLRKEGAWLNRRFFCFHTRKRPYIILKWAQTTDGFIGNEDKSSLQITGPESLQLSHRWRTEEAAIMVGHTTALNDNPQLTARLYKGRQPLRIALDRNLSLPHTHHLFNDDAATWIINDREETVSGNVHYVHIPFTNLLPALLSRLFEARILSIIVEGGAHLLNSFIEAGLWDEARVFTAGLRLEKGVPAPILRSHTVAHSATCGNDHLQILTNTAAGFAWSPAIE